MVEKSLVNVFVQEILETKSGSKFLLTDKGVYLIENKDYEFDIMASKRINIDYAGEWVDKPWRFFVKGNTYVSKVNF